MLYKRTVCRWQDCCTSILTVTGICHPQLLLLTTDISKCVYVSKRADINHHGNVTMFVTHKQATHSEFMRDTDNSSSEVENRTQNFTQGLINTNFATLKTITAFTSK